MTTSVLDRMAASRANYWLGFALDVTVSLALVVAGAVASGARPAVLGAFAAGWLSYTLYEYALHRWVYHGPPSPISRIHAWHHRDGEVLLGAPFFFTLAVCAANWGLASLLVGRALAGVFAGTVLVLYATQSAIHHLAHTWEGSAPLRIRGNGLLGRLRRHHMIHHHGDGNANFGVSTTLWDRVFGTATNRVERR